MVKPEQRCVSFLSVVVLRGTWATLTLTGLCSCFRQWVRCSLYNTVLLSPLKTERSPLPLLLMVEKVVIQLISFPCRPSTCVPVGKVFLWGVHIEGRVLRLWRVWGMRRHLVHFNWFSQRQFYLHGCQGLTLWASSVQKPSSCPLWLVVQVTG